MQAVAEVQRRYPEGVPLLSPEEDMSIKDSAFRKAQRCGSVFSPPWPMFVNASIRPR